MLDATTSLLLKIKADIQSIMSADNHDCNMIDNKEALIITDEIRHKIIKILVAHSDAIPHPAAIAKKRLGDDEETNSLTFSLASSPTLLRWQILAYVASIDLTISKWFESHLDALSILHEIGYDQSVQGLWAVWASEGHPSPIRYQQGKMSGTKAWCSGANIVDWALMTYRDALGCAQLLIVDMQQSGIETNNREWQAVGMQATDTGTITFNQVTAETVGSDNAYLHRVGFWHGAAGVAACWYGAAACLASYLIKAYQQKPHDYKAMYLGQISSALAVTQQYFYHVAQLIQTTPQQSHELAIRQLRANVEQLSRLVIETVGQALGAAPFCRDAHFARLSADLAVFIRQSHGAFDLQKIGELSSSSCSDLDNDSDNDSDNLKSYGSLFNQGNIWQL